MHPLVQELLILQEVDAAILEGGKVLERYAVSRESRSKEVKRATDRVREVKEKVLQLEKSVRESERQVLEWRASLGKFAAQQSVVKTQKEYDTLTHEIDVLESKISDADEKGLEFLEGEEALAESLEKMKADLAKKEEDFRVEIERIDEREAQKKAELETLQARRNATAGAMTPSLLKDYENLRHRFHGTCVVPLEGNICGGCFMKVVSQRIYSAGCDDHDLVRCNACRRFLYTKG